MTVAACVLAIGGLVLGVAVTELAKTNGPTVGPVYDQRYTGDPAPLHDLVVPASFHDVKDRPDCLANKFYRCFVTRMERPQVLAYLHGAVGAHAHDNNDSHLLPGWTACGDLMGAPAVARISHHISNAVRTGPGEWRIPRSGPEYDERLTVMIFLVESPHCA